MDGSRRDFKSLSLDFRRHWHMLRKSATLKGEKCRIERKTTIASAIYVVCVAISDTRTQRSFTFLNDPQKRAAH